ncbi:hypothetical protein ABTY96_06755 [Streptomyces sp. NPDC096057]
MSTDVAPPMLDQLITESSRNAARVQDLTRAKTNLARVIDHATAVNVAQD